MLAGCQTVGYQSVSNYRTQGSQFRKDLRFKTTTNEMVRTICGISEHAYRAQTLQGRERRLGSTEK